MAKVLFVNFPPQGLDIPSIGIASLFANIRDLSETDIFDFNIELYYENFFQKTRWEFSEHKFWESETTAVQLLHSKTYLHLMDMLKNDDYDIICFSINVHGYKTLNLILDHIFEQIDQKLVLVGGPFCSETELKNLHKSKHIDLFVVGEGELVLKDVIKLYRKKNSIKGLKNIQITDTGNTFIVSDKITDLSILKNPDYSLFDIRLYNCKNSIPIYFSRGCDYNCCFCRDKPIWGRNVWKNPKSIIKEMMSLNKQYGISDFYAVDLDVLSNLNKIQDLCKLIIEKNLNVSWSGQARVNREVTSDLLKIMQQAGCHSLCIGLESGSSHVCRDMGKENPEIVSKFIKTASNVKIKISLAVIVGYPTETWWDFSKTVFFLLKNFKYVTRIPSINIFHIPSESVMFSNLDKYNIKLMDGDWEIKGKNTILVRKMRYRILDLIVSKLFRFKRYI